MFSVDIVSKLRAPFSEIHRFRSHSIPSPPPSPSLHLPHPDKNEQYIPIRVFRLCDASFDFSLHFSVFWCFFFFFFFYICQPFHFTVYLHRHLWVKRNKLVPRFDRVCIGIDNNNRIIINSNRKSEISGKAQASSLGIHAAPIRSGYWPVAMDDENEFARVKWNSNAKAIQLPFSFKQICIRVLRSVESSSFIWNLNKFIEHLLPVYLFHLVVYLLLLLLDAGTC